MQRPTHLTATIEQADGTTVTCRTLFDFIAATLGGHADQYALSNIETALSAEITDDLPAGVTLNGPNIFIEDDGVDVSFDAADAAITDALASDVVWDIAARHKLSDLPTPADVDRFVIELDQSLPPIWEGEPAHRVTVAWDGNDTVTFHVDDPLDQIDHDPAELTFATPPLATADGYFAGQYSSGDMVNDFEHPAPMDADDFADHVAAGVAPQDAVLRCAATHLDDLRDALVAHVRAGVRRRAHTAMQGVVDQIKAGGPVGEIPTPGPDTIFGLSMDDGDLTFDLPGEDVTMAEAGCSADDIALVRTWAAERAAERAAGAPGHL